MYVRTGFGAISEPGPLIASAVTAVINDPSVALSPQSQIFSAVVSTVFETAAKEAASIAVEAAAGVLGDVATSAVSTAVNAIGQIPLLGTIVSWARGIVDGVTGIKQEEIEKLSALLQQCARADNFFRPVRTYDTSLPTDLFGIYDAEDAQKLGGLYSATGYQGSSLSAVTMPGGGADSWSMQARRPALGSFLIALTEGAKPDNGLYTWPSLVPPGLGSNGRHAASYDVVIGIIRAALKNNNLGIPQARRAQFKALRLGIEAQRKHQPVGSTDGGVALWTLYMDLLAEAFKKGWLTDQFVFLMTDASTPCPSSILTTQIRNLVDSWNLKLNPWYAAGVAEQAAIRAQALAIAKAAATPKKVLTKAPAVKKPVSTTLVAAVTKQLRAKQESTNLWWLIAGGMVTAGGVYAYSRYRRHA